MGGSSSDILLSSEGDDWAMFTKVAEILKAAAIPHPS